MLEKLNDAVCVEDMATRKLGACFGSKLSRVANCAQLFLIDTLKVTGALSAVNIEARKAVALFGNALAGVPTLLMLLIAEGNRGFLLGNDILIERVDLNDLIFLHLKGGELEASTDWDIRGTTFEGGEASLKHRHLLFFAAVVRSSSH